MLLPAWNSRGSLFTGILKAPISICLYDARTGQGR
jgi:hypothetical protein